MAAGGHTFIDDMLRYAGFENVSLRNRLGLLTPEKTSVIPVTRNDACGNFN
ncbi:MAG: hypothetical protein Q7U74_08625 [Saprospiraceae bacterium]|nr:hypothetical protein [Saprospiraceae bacterium]